MTNQEQMEIKYAPALQKLEVPQFNFEDLKKQISVNIEKYRNLVVTEDAIQDAKKTKADLNRFKTMVDNERKRLKNIYLEPYEKIKPQFDELFSLIDEPVKAINTQIQNFETKEKQEKLAEIEKAYKANIGTLEALVPFSVICKPEWENKANTLKKIEKEMIEAIEKINSDLRVISGFRSDFETSLRTEYLKSFNLEAVLNLKQSLEDQAKYIEEQKAIEEQKTLDKAADVLAETMKEEQKNIETALHVVEPIQEKTYHQCFWVDATKAQLMALNDFLAANNFEFGVIQQKNKAIA